MVSPCTPHVSDRIGRIEVCTTAGRPTGAARYHGKYIFDSDVSSELRWNQTTSNWDIINEPLQDWTSVTVTQSASVAGTINAGWYRRSLGVFEAFLYWTSSAAGTGGNDITISLPLTLSNADYVWGTFAFRDASPVTHYIGRVADSTTTAIRLRTNAATDDLGTNPAFTIASGDSLRLDVRGRY